MNCREFERLLPEWVSQRLPSDTAARMQAHSAECTACRRSMAAERLLRQRWQDLPGAAETPNIWPHLVQRLNAPAVYPTAAGRRKWAFSGALAATALAATLGILWLRPMPPMPGAGSALTPVSDTSENKIVKLISDAQNLPDTETDAFFTETQQVRQDQSRLLLRKGE